MKKHFLATTALVLLMTIGHAEARTITAANEANKELMSNEPVMNSTAPASAGNMNESLPSADSNADASMNGGVDRMGWDDTNPAHTGASGNAPRMSNDNEMTTRTGHAMGAANRAPSRDVPVNMTSDQFDDYVTRRWDRNGDGVVSRREWTSASSHWYGRNNRTNVGSFAKWDANGDGRLDADELNNFLNQSNLYSRYDRNGDGIIDSDELHRFPNR